jgi:hypothetical protein
MDVIVKQARYCYRRIFDKENAMPQAQTMTTDEKITIGFKAMELKKQGKMEEYEQTMKSLPMPPPSGKGSQKTTGF